MTVLRQIAAHLDGWSDLRTRVTTEDLDWPGVHVTRNRSGAGAQVWRCVHDRWTGHLLGDDASASEVADGIKAVYRMLRTSRRPADAQDGLTSRTGVPTMNACS